MSTDIKEQSAPAWLQPPAVTSEEQVKKDYFEELRKAHRHNPPEPQHLATAAGMRRTLFSLGILTDLENHGIVEKAKKAAKVDQRIIGISVRDARRENP